MARSFGRFRYSSRRRAAPRRSGLGAPRSGVATGEDYVAMRALRASNRFSLRGPSVRGNLGQQIKQLQRWTTRQKPELKFKDISLAATNVSNDGTTIALTTIAQGSTSSTRIGDLINVQSVTMKFLISPGSDSASRWQYRFLLVQDKQNVPDGLIAASDVIADNVNAKPDPLACLVNPQNTERFNILWVSELYDAGLGCGQNGSATSTQTNCVECFWQGTVKVYYNGAATSDDSKNSLYFVALTNSTASTVDFSGVARVTFTDA